MKISNLHPRSRRSLAAVCGSSHYRRPLYVLQVLSVFYRLNNGSGSSAWTYAGFAVMLCGIVLESAADTVAVKKVEIRLDKNRDLI